MTRRIIQTVGRDYTFSPEDPIPLASRHWAVVDARVIDELTDTPPSATITIKSDLAHSSPRVVGTGQGRWADETARFNSPPAAGDGLVGLVGVPVRIFPGLALRNYTVQLTIQAQGYIPRQVTAVIPNDQRTIVGPPPALNDTVITLNDTARLNAGEFLLIGPPVPTWSMVKIRSLGPAPNQVIFAPALPRSYSIGDPVVPVVPSNFAPTRLGDVTLHRQPVVIRGRVVRVSSGITPLAGATIRVTGIWRKAPPANLTVPADPPNLVSLHPPIYFDRMPGTAQLRRRNLPGLPDTPANEKRLLEHVSPGSRDIFLTNQVGLSMTSILLIDVANPELVEFVEVDTVTGGATPDLPVRIALKHALAFEHRAGALVQVANAHPLGAILQFAQAAQSGDTCVFLANLSGLAAGNEARITGGPNPDEYHRVNLFSVTSNADGYYRLPPMSRVAQLEILAEHQGGLTLTMPSAAGTDTITVSDVSLMTSNQSLRVGPAAGPLEPVVIQSINPATRVVRLTANLAADKNIGDLVTVLTPVRKFSPDYTASENQLDFTFG